MTSSVLKALNIIYMVSPLPSISPVRSSHLNLRLVNPTQLHFPKPNADGDSSPNMLLPESPHFHSRCPTCLLANLKFCSPSSLFLIIQIKSTRKCCKMHFQNRSRIHSPPSSLLTPQTSSSLPWTLRCFPQAPLRLPCPSPPDSAQQPG